jgi:DNA polymerase-3 subunit delta'
VSDSAGVLGPSIGLGGVIGHRSTRGLVARLLQRDRLPHAILFEGPEGTGRRTLAMALAAARLCHRPIDGDACGACPSCELICGGVHPDLVTLPSPAERADLPVDLVKEIVVLRASETPLAGSHRVFVLPALERLRKEGANALLKILEEPPAGTHLLMTTGLGAGLLPTIRSRSQRLRTGLLTTEEVAQVLQRAGKPAPEAARLAARSAGSHRDCWGATGEAAPIESLCAIIGDGYDARALVRLIDALGAGAKHLSGPAASPAAQQRRLLDRWLGVAQEQLRGELRGADPEQTCARIERVLRARRDLNLNLAPRLVLEGLALPFA